MNSFIQTRGYLEGEDDNLKLYGGEGLEKETTYQLLIIDTDSTYKQRLEAVSQIHSDMIIDLSKNQKEYGSKLSQHGIDLHLTYILLELGRFFGYLMNSTSWNTQKIQPYDKIEFLKRVDRLVTLLK